MPLSFPLASSLKANIFQNYQQTLDIVVGEDEKIFFKVTGTHEVHLTGNYVIPIDDGQTRLYGDEDEDDYDLSPDEDELDALEDMEDDEESDELDDIADPRVMEVDTDEEAPKLIEPAAKGKNKRPAEDSDEEDANLDDIMAKSIKPSEPTTNGEDKPLTKAEKKKLKKLKKNDGGAAPVETTLAGTNKESKTGKKSPEASKKEAATNGEKKVQFAKNLEQGPTSSGTPPAKETAKESAKPNSSLGVKDVQGVTIDDRKLGTGPQAKKGNHVEMRYIGKLESGKVFDGESSEFPA
jgi:FK506-binding nuclear protein